MTLDKTTSSSSSSKGGAIDIGTAAGRTAALAALETFAAQQQQATLIGSSKAGSSKPQAAIQAGVPEGFATWERARKAAFIRAMNAGSGSYDTRGIFVPDAPKHGTVRAIDLATFVANFDRVKGSTADLAAAFKALDDKAGLSRKHAPMYAAAAAAAQQQQKTAAKAAAAKAAATRAAGKAAGAKAAAAITATPAPRMALLQQAAAAQQAVALATDKGIKAALSKALDQALDALAAFDTAAGSSK